MQDEKSYRVSDEDAILIGLALKDIHAGIFSLCRMPHKCLERSCDYCNALDVLAGDIERTVRRLAKNPIARAEAEELEHFKSRIGVMSS